MFILSELWPRGVVGEDEGVDVAEDDDGNGGNEESLLPDLPALKIKNKYV